MLQTSYDNNNVITVNYMTRFSYEEGDSDCLPNIQIFRRLAGKCDLCYDISSLPRSTGDGAGPREDLMWEEHRPLARPVVDGDLALIKVYSSSNIAATAKRVWDFRFYRQSR